MLAKLTQILQMIRFSHTLFAMPFALISALLAWSLPNPQQVLEGLEKVQPLAHFRCARTYGGGVMHDHGPQRGDGLQSDR